MSDENWLHTRSVPFEIIREPYVICESAVKMKSYEFAFRLRQNILQIFREVLKGIFFVYYFIISDDFN